MVVEELFKAKWAEKRPSYSILLGMLFTLISFITSFLLFRNAPTFIGVSTILFTVILIAPTVNRLFDIEEKLEVKEKLSFFIKHEHIIDFFIYFFIGVFIVLYFIALLNPGFVFSEESLYGIQKTIEIDPNSKLPPPPPLGTDRQEIISIFKNNFYVMIISFILSLFYGAGALFLITLNASIFASALAKVTLAKLPGVEFVSTYSFMLCNLGIMFFHLIPEVSGYLLAAIAGGVLSHAVIREKIGSKNFRIVLMDSIVLLIASIIFLILAAIIENEISKKLFTGNVCVESDFFIISLTLSFLLGLILFEFIRKTKHSRKKAKFKKKKVLNKI